MAAGFEALTSKLGAAPPSRIPTLKPPKLGGKPGRINNPIHNPAYGTPGNVTTTTGQNYQTSYSPTGQISFTPEQPGTPKPLGSAGAGALGAAANQHPPPGAAAPGAPPTAPAGAGAAAQPWLSDPTYIANVGAETNKVNQNVADLQQTLGFDQTNLQAALAKLAYQQPRDALGVEQKANQRGSLYSSLLGQQEGNLAYQYAGRQGGLNDNFAKTSAGIQDRISGLKQGLAAYIESQRLAAAQRTPLPNGPAAPGSTPDTTAPATTPAPTGTPGQPVYNNGGYAGVAGSDGKPVPVNLAQAYANLLAQKGKGGGAAKGKGKGVEAKTTRERRA